MKGTQTFRIKILKEVRPEERFDTLYEVNLAGNHV